MNDAKFTKIDELFFIIDSLHFEGIRFFWGVMISKTILNYDFWDKFSRKFQYGSRNETSAP